MTTELIAYIDRDNEERLELLQDDILVTASVITRAVFKFGDYCIDTDIDTDEIYFLDSDNQTLCFRLGLIDNLVVGKYKKGTLTLFDASNTNGIAWVLLDVRVKEWEICSA